MHIEPLEAPVPGPDLDALCGLLCACVCGGASIGFVEPMGSAEAQAYWKDVEAEARKASRLVLVAREGPGLPIIGSAQLAFVSKPNGRHRAEVQKVLVLPSERRRGIASLLMRAVESEASGRGVRLLHLDTSEGRSGAREFYEALGYAYVGGIPGFALDPGGSPAKNAIYYKTLP